MPTDGMTGASNSPAVRVARAASRAPRKPASRARVGSGASLSRLPAGAAGEQQTGAVTTGSDRCGVNPPGLPEARVLESVGVAGILLAVVGGLELGRWDMADRLQEPAVVEPVDPLQGGVLDLVEALPGAAPADQLSRVQPDDRLGQGVIEPVPAAAYGGDRPRLGQPLGVANGDILAALSE